MRATATRAAVAVSAVAAATFISFFRLPQTVWDTVWAEDGPVFLQQAMDEGGAGTVFAPYGGYLHVLPRLAAQGIVHLVPVENFAVGLALVSCSVVAVVAYLTFHCAAALTSNLWARLAWAAVPVLVSVGPYEILGNTANLHWYLLWLVPWLLLKPARSGAEAAMLFLAAGMCALSEVISVLFLPLVLLHIRDKAFWPARAGMLIGAGLQIGTALLYPRGSGGGPALDPVSVVTGWFINVAGVVFFGSSRNMGLNILNFGTAPVVLAFLPVAAALACLLLRARREHRWLALMFVTASFGVWAACLVANPGAEYNYAHLTESQWRQFSLSRYSAVPAMFVLALFPLLAVSFPRPAPHVPGAVLASFAVLLAVSYFPTQVSREQGPSWSQGVAGARAACIGAGDDETRTVQVAPLGWSVSGVAMPCPRLRD